MCVRCRKPSRAGTKLEDFQSALQLICFQFSRDNKIYMFNNQSVFYGANLCLTLRRFSQSQAKFEEHYYEF